MGQGSRALGFSLWLEALAFRFGPVEFRIVVFVCISRISHCKSSAPNPKYFSLSRGLHDRFILERTCGSGWVHSLMVENSWASDFDIGKTEAQYFRNLNVKQKLATLFEPVALQQTPWSRP